MRKPFLHLFLLSLILSSAACAMTVNHDTKTHTESITSMKFDQPFGAYEVSSIEVSALPPVVKGNNYLSLRIDVTCKKNISKTDIEKLMQDLYTVEKLPNAVIMSSLEWEKDTVRLPFSIAIGTHFPLTPHAPSGELPFEVNLSKLKETLKRHFSVSDEALKEIEKVLGDEKAKRIALLK